MDVPEPIERERQDKRWHVAVPDPQPEEVQRGGSDPGGDALQYPGKSADLLGVVCLSQFVHADTDEVTGYRGSRSQRHGTFRY